MTIEPLDWDSDFFGIKVGRCSLNDNEEWEHEKLTGWDLVYFFIHPAHERANQHMKNQNIVLVDEKVTFVMDLPAHDQDFLLTDIYSYTRDKQVAEVIRIGIQSGIHSRFCIDDRIPKKKFEELYTIWMSRSIDRELAREVYVFKTNDGKIAGVITLGDKNDRADIGIIAVEEKMRGLNIGSKLIKAAINNSIETGHKTLQVVTQKSNRSACRFYEQCGFREEQVVNIYHYWNKQ